MTKGDCLAAAVIVYNVHCMDSDTCRALAQMNEPDLHVVIYDNSTKQMGNQEFCRQRGWSYLGGSGNVGLSKAYNRCIEYLKEQGLAGTVCLFDDDTAIDPTYFSLLRKAMAAGEESIFVPLIYSGEKLMSPCLLHPGHRIELFGSEKEAFAYNGRALSAINSCMAVRLSVFDSYRYDENIFLDGVDHAFLSDMKARQERIKVFPYRCAHAFSGDSVPSKNSALNRFVIFKRDFSYILRNDRLTYYRIVGKRMLKLTVQYKSADFFKQMLRKDNRK